MKISQPPLLDFILPESYKILEEKFIIKYGFHSTIFGNCLIALETDRICYLSFGSDNSPMFDSLKKEWYGANVLEENIGTKKIIEKIFTPYSKSKDNIFKLLVKGTNFQVRVWKALCQIPFGSTISYETVAKMVGNPKGIRASANSIGKNNIAFLIPCHRVIKKSGHLHKYRWGEDLKKAMIEWEIAQSLI